MAFETASNPKTGETAVRIDGLWYVASETASGPNNARAYKIGDMWYRDDLETAPKAEPAAPAPKTEGNTAADYGSAIMAGLGKIPATAIGGAAALGDLLTGAKYDLGVQQAMEENKASIDDYWHTENVKKQTAAFKQAVQSDDVSFGDTAALAIDSPALMVDQVITTIGSMLLPMGTAGAASKIAKGLKAGEKTVSKAVTATTILTTASQNAADTFAALKDQPLEKRYEGAAVSGALSILAGLATKGGAEGALARKMAGELKAGKIGLDAAKEFIRTVGSTMLKEGAQESGEEVGNILGETVGGKPSTPLTAAKRTALAGTLGVIVGGPSGVVEAVQGVTPAPKPTTEEEKPASEEELHAAAKALHDEQGVPMEEALRTVREAQAWGAPKAAPSAEAAPETPPAPTFTPEQEAQIAEAAAIVEQHGVPPDVARDIAIDRLGLKPIEEPAPTPEIAEAPAPVAETAETAAETPAPTEVAPAAMEEKTYAPEALPPGAVSPRESAYQKISAAVQAGEVAPTYTAVREQLGVPTQHIRPVLQRMAEEGRITPTGKKDKYEVAPKAAPAPEAQAAPAPTEVTPSAPIPASISPVAAVTQPEAQAAPAPQAEATPVQAEAVPAPEQVPVSAPTTAGTESVPAVRGKRAPAPKPVAPAPTAEAAPTPGVEPVEGTQSPAEIRAIREARAAENKAVKAFEKGIGATSSGVAGTIKARQNLAAGKAARAGNAPAVIAALEKSKNHVVAEIAKRAKNLGVTIKSSETEAGEQHTIASPAFLREQQRAAANHVELLDAMRKVQDKVAALPEGRAAISDITTGITIPYVDPYTGDVHTMSLGQAMHSAAAFTWHHTNVPEVGFGWQTKGEFERLLQNVESQTSNLGEARLRRAARATTEVDAVAGRYEPDTNTIVVGDYHAADEHVLAHELVHAQVAHAIDNPTPRQKPIVKRLQKLFDHVKSKLPDSQAYGLTTEHEFIAEGMSNPNFQYLLNTIPYENETAWSKFVKYIADLIGVKANTAFTELLSVYEGLTKEPAAKKQKGPAAPLYAMTPPPTAPQGPAPRATVSSIAGTPVPTQTAQSTTAGTAQSAQQAAQAAKDLQERVDHAKDVFARSQSAEDFRDSISAARRLFRMKQWLPMLREVFDAARTERKALEVLFATASPDLIVDMASQYSQLQDLKRAHTLEMQMNGHETQLLRAGEHLRKDVFEAVKDNLKAFNEALIVSSVAQVDARTNHGNADVNAIYNRLTPEQKKAYGKVQDYYKDMADYTKHTLQTNIASLEVPLAQKNAVLGRLNDLLDVRKRIEGYFPLTRNQEGPYWFSVGKGKGADFHTFTSDRERDLVAEEIAKSRGTTVAALRDSGDINIGNDLDQLRKRMLEGPDNLLREIMELVDTSDFGIPAAGGSSAGIAARAKDNMKDAIFSMWVTLQPERSLHKQFTHRKEWAPAGFNTDTLQVLSQSVNKFSTQLPRLRYAPQMRQAIRQAEDSIRHYPELSPYVAEMRKRIETSLDSSPASAGERAIDAINKFTFGYYMSMSTGMLQVFSAYQTGIPQLLKHHSYGAVTAEMTKILNVFNSMGVRDANGDWHMPTLESSSELKVNPKDSPEVARRKQLERTLVQRMGSLDVAEQTVARNIYGMNAIPTSKTDSTLQKCKDTGAFLVSGVIHHGDRIAREMVYLASARLWRNKMAAAFRNSSAYKNAADPAAAEHAYLMSKADDIAFKAAMDVRESQFKADRYSKPAFMNKGMGRLMSLFATYNFNATKFMLRNMLGMVKPLGTDTRVGCMKAFTAAMLNTFVMSGTTGLLGAALMLKAIASAWDDEEDKKSGLHRVDPVQWWKKEFLPNLTAGATIAGQDISKFMQTVLDRGVLNAVTGLDFASRTDMASFGVHTGEGDSGKQWVDSTILKQLGPSVAMAEQYGRAVNDLMDGKYEQAAERAAPWANLRNVIKAGAYKFGKGAVGKEDNVLVQPDALTWWETTGRVAGIEPDIVAEQRKGEFAIQAVLKSAQSNKQRILHTFKRQLAEQKPDPEKLATMILDYNTKYGPFFPDTLVTGATLDESLKGWIAAKENTYMGHTYTKQDMILAHRILSNTHEVLRKRLEEKTRK